MSYLGVGNLYFLVLLYGHTPRGVCGLKRCYWGYPIIRGSRHTPCGVCGSIGDINECFVVHCHVPCGAWGDVNLKKVRTFDYENESYPPPRGPRGPCNHGGHPSPGDPDVSDPAGEGCLTPYLFHHDHWSCPMVGLRDRDRRSPSDSRQRSDTGDRLLDRFYETVVWEIEHFTVDIDLHSHSNKITYKK